TWALNAAVCCFRLPLIVSPFLGHHRSLAGGPVFGVHYNPRPGDRRFISSEAANFLTRRNPTEGITDERRPYRQTESLVATKRSPKGGNTHGDRVPIVARRLG